MSDSDRTNTALALAGASHALLANLMEALVNKGHLTAVEAVGLVQVTRRQLEAPNGEGGVRASVYLEPVEEQLQRLSKPD